MQIYIRQSADLKDETNLFYSEGADYMSDGSHFDVLFSQTREISRLKGIRRDCFSQQNRFDPLSNTTAGVD